MVYSAIVPKSECVVSELRLNSSESIEPSKILARVPKSILESEMELVAIVSDGRKRIEYTLPQFLSTSYPIRGEHVKFGSVFLVLSQLSIVIGVKLLVEDLSHLEQDGVD